MNRIRLFPFLLAALCLLSLPSFAQAQAQRGLVRAFAVTGDVSIRNDVTGAITPVTRGMEFRDGNTIITGENAKATFVQSNGSTIVVEENTSLSVSEFRQDPYDRASLGTYTNLQSDPSESRTRLRLNRGEASGNVNGLRANSRYNVDLPTGSAGIRGTTWRAIVFLDLETGVANVLVLNADGSIAFAYQDPDTGITEEIDIAPGTQLTSEATLEATSTEDNLQVIDITIESDDASPDEVRETLNEVTEAIREAEETQQQEDDTLQDDFAPGDDDDDGITDDDTGDDNVEPPAGDVGNEETLSNPEGQG